MTLTAAGLFGEQNNFLSLSGIENVISRFQPHSLVTMATVLHSCDGSTNVHLSGNDTCDGGWYKKLEQLIMALYL